MSTKNYAFGALDAQGKQVLLAEIIRKETMFGNIRIRCPLDGTEHEIPALLGRFICPVSGDILVIIL